MIGMSDTLRYKLDRYHPKSTTFPLRTLRETSHRTAGVCPALAQRSQAGNDVSYGELTVHGCVMVCPKMGVYPEFWLVI